MQYNANQVHEHIAKEIMWAENMHFQYSWTPVISNTVTSNSPFSRTKKPFPLDLPFSHLLSAISKYFSFPLRVRNSGVKL